MKFDTATIVSISIAIDIIFVLILLHTWRTRTTYAGFIAWIIGTACWSLGSILVMLFPSLHPQFIPKIVGNALLMLHPLLLYEGIRQFHGIRKRWWGTPLNAVLVLVGIANQLYFFYISDNVVVRSAGIGLIIAILFIRVSLEILFYAAARRFSMQWLLSVSLLPLITLLFARGWVLLSGSPLRTFSAMIANDTLLGWINLYAIFGELIIAYSYLSLTSARVEEQLRTSEQCLIVAHAAEKDARILQERFLDMVSHEYRTPLAIIQTNIDIIELKEQQLSHGYSEYLENMHYAVERLVDVFDTTRSRKNFDLATLAPDFALVKIEECLQETLPSARVFWGDRFVCVNNTPPDSWLRADRRLVRTVILNLLDNAVKYSPLDLLVTVRVDIRGEQMELAIVNHQVKVAMLPKNREELFERFRRGSNSANTGGTGQGLYLARGIVEQHGGTLELTVDAHDDVVALLRLPLASDFRQHDLADVAVSVPFRSNSY